LLKDEISARNLRIQKGKKTNILLIIISCLILILFALALILFILKRKYATKLNKLNIRLDDKVKERTRELKRSFKKLRKEIETRKKLESEIKIAAEIQQGILPNITEIFKRAEFDLHAALEPAGDAAGDFYDFFYISDNKLALIVGDVSGKGITAALFMAFAKTVLKNICLHETNPANVIQKANDILATDNAKCMFVTLFLVFYDISTGYIEYANAGHHDTILVNEESYSLFGRLNDIPLGVYKNIDFHKGTIQLKPNDTFICYTDGITEAISPNNEEFGEEQLCNFVFKNNSKSVSDISKEVIKNVINFEANNRFDDITILIFRRNI
jgi:phosphoserine phosphatase RsbU/P